MWPSRRLLHIALVVNIAMVALFVARRDVPIYSLLAIALLAGMLIVHPDTRGKP